MKVLMISFIKHR